MSHIKPQILTTGQNTELYGLEVNLLAPSTLDAYQVIMARPNASILNSGRIRQDAEVIL